jgi:hypothetical protein
MKWEMKNLALLAVLLIGSLNAIAGDINPPSPLVGGLLYNKKAHTYLGLTCVSYEGDVCTGYQWLKNENDLSVAEDWVILNAVPKSLGDLNAQFATISANDEPEEHLLYSDETPLVFTNVGLRLGMGIGPFVVVSIPVGFALDVVTSPIQIPSKIIRVINKHHRRNEEKKSEAAVLASKDGKIPVMKISAGMVALIKWSSYVTCHDVGDPIPGCGHSQEP